MMNLIKKNLPNKPVIVTQMPDKLKNMTVDAQNFRKRDINTPQIIRSRENDSDSTNNKNLA